jgi:hypothetical protein
MMKIIERDPCVSNKDMWDKCELLRNICDAKVERKIGRGKSVETILVPRYKTHPDDYNRIVNSCEYYKKLYEEEMTGNITFRDYQLEIINDGSKILKDSGFLYLAMEVRTGKTLTSLGIAKSVGAKEVLFITKKIAIGSIESDYRMLNPSYKITVINYESLHLVMDLARWDLVICDEAHSMGAFPKPSQRADLVRQVLKKYTPMVILLSGTPTPESYSQMYHQVYGIPNNPFAEFTNFYRFCDKYVDVKEKKLNGLYIKDYSHGRESILDAMRPYTINYTQREAGFVSNVTEEVLEVEMKESTYRLIDKLKRDLVIEGRDEVILADTPVKLMMKVHQLSSGTIKFESGASMILDTTKAEFIRSRFASSKIGIFYKFKEELNALKQVFGDSLTTDLDEFNGTGKNIALQIVSGREGISLRNADYLVYYNIDFSATSYWQSKDRMTTKERLENNVFWVFSKGGIEHEIYKAVTKKKDFTVNHFKKLLL